MSHHQHGCSGQASVGVMSLLGQGHMRRQLWGQSLGSDRESSEADGLFGAIPGVQVCHVDHVEKRFCCLHAS